ncbi:protein of unknown function DUF1801 [Paenibacillus curdlanolyticus YK9]|uniref:YdhG-like domain-containing protein n=1 Tax=Paenibacillus curdlanolyticus YK9 TaxID=717606 RepID=E0IA51_9BACL|nr:DUF1801 domain-containing protein [Paenibacillus curdlanolyticus]EFM10628.1 protein of unknown function DUF1801 [Paenibacillus curdlanolyticus YK9]
MEENKSAYETIDAYIGSFPPEVQDVLQTLRRVIREAAPEAMEKISYQMPTFAQNGNLVYFAAYKKHIGFYPTSSGIAAFQHELEAYKVSKGTVQFPLGQLLPYELITRIVKHRVEANREKAASKRTKKTGK